MAIIKFATDFNGGMWRCAAMRLHASVSRIRGRIGQRAKSKRQQRAEEGTESATERAEEGTEIAAQRESSTSEQVSSCIS
jgi:hypothetical protein